MRAGATAWRRDGRIQGAVDLPLSSGGRAAVEAEIPRFVGRRVAIVHHAPDEASTASAGIVARALGARTRSVGDFAEPHLGLLEGLRESEFRERHPRRARQWEEDPYSLVPPDGEPIGDARQRILRACERVIRRTRAEEVVVVSGPLAWGIMTSALHGDAFGPHEAADRVARLQYYVLPAAAVSTLRSAELPHPATGSTS